MKKSNAILEYGILIVIVVAAIMGVNQFLGRSIKGYIKDIADSKIKKPIPFLWQGGVNINIQDANVERTETYNGDIEEASEMDVSYTSITAPVPPYIDVAGLHVQDPPDGGSGQQKRNPQTKRERRQPDESAE